MAPRQDEIYEKWRRFYSSALRAADDRIRGDGSPGDQATGLGHDEAEDTRKVLRVTAVIIEYSGWSTFSAACAALGWGLAVFVAAMAPLIAAPPVALALMIAVGTSGTAVIYLSWKHRDILRMAKAIGADFRPKFRSIRKEFGRSPEGMRALDSLYNQCVDRIVENISREAA